MKWLLHPFAEVALVGLTMVAVVQGFRAIDWAAGLPSADQRVINTAWMGDEGGLADALRDGGVISAKDEYGRTALTYAAMSGEMESVRTLLALGADVNASDQHGWSPLMSAACFDHQEVVRVLLQHGADPTLRTLDTRQTAHEIAVRVDADESVRALAGWAPHRSTHFNAQ